MEETTTRRTYCADCGEPDERTGHLDCEYPQDHDMSDGLDMPSYGM